MFLILSAITALLECGSIFLGTGLGYSPGQILSFCLAYQFGNLFPIPFHLPKKELITAACLSPIFLCLARCSDENTLFQWLFYFVGIMLLSCTLQSIRAVQKSQTSTIKKRMARVIGFLLSPFMMYASFPLLLICCFIVLFSIPRVLKMAAGTEKFIFSDKIINQNPYYKIMLWHQLHYFTYAYAMVLLVYEITNSAFLTMFLFACTWLTYLTAEPLWNYLNSSCFKIINKLPGIPKNKIIILAGHAFLILMLLQLSKVNSLLSSIFWILTGFGGGTVFAITALCQCTASYKKVHLEFIENTGHFIGTALTVIWALLFPQKISYLSYLSVFCVIVVLVLTLKGRDSN